MPRESRPRPWVLILTLFGLVVTGGIRIARSANVLPASDWANFVSGLAPAFGVAVLLALVVYVIFTSVRLAARRRQSTAGSKHVARLESLAMALVAFVFFATAFGDATGAFLSLGLVGFGLTLALQRPILALAGWSTIFFGRLFREGDRIEVMGIVGDVLEINLFTTRLWEIGSAASPLPSGGNVAPNRPTGRSVLVSNAVFVEHPMANASTDMPFVFDEFAVTIAYEADRVLAERILMESAAAVLDPHAHSRAAVEYEALTRGMPMESKFPKEPVIIASLEESWIELRLRYLVDVRSRAATRTRLAERWLESSLPHGREIPNVYRRIQSQTVGQDGRAKD